MIGHAFDKGLWRALQLSGPEAVTIMRAQFFETTFTLLGFVAKADGRVSEAEHAQTEALFNQLRLNAAQRQVLLSTSKKALPRALTRSHRDAVQRLSRPSAGRSTR